MKTAVSVPDAKADGSKLRQFFGEVAPDHDEEKVYASDMKKIVSWYNILKDMPLFSEEPAAPEAGSVTETSAQPAPKPKAEKAKPGAEKAKPVSKGKTKPTVVAKRGA